MSDSEDTTVFERIRRPRKSYDGDDRRAPPPFDVMKWLPLALACIAGVSGYTEIASDVKHMGKDVERIESAHEKDMNSYLGWNKSISERVRELERE
jgi:hypothetical protein